jgi:hypothetical protein
MIKIKTMLKVWDRKLKNIIYRLNRECLSGTSITIFLINSPKQHRLLVEITTLHTVMKTATTWHISTAY